jgi:asparagine N-glycosylation enzyme membrane subunit Stt3
MEVISRQLRAEYPKDNEERGIRILPPDVNRSGADFSVELVADGTLAIRYALAAVKKVGFAAMAALVIVLTYPLTKEFGLWGAQLAILIAIVVGYVLQMERIREVIGLKLPEYRKILVVPIAISLCAVLACLAAKSVGILLRPLPNIIFGILGCLIATGVACAVFFREGNGIVQSEGASRPAYNEQP